MTNDDAVEDLGLLALPGHCVAAGRGRRDGSILQQGELRPHGTQATQLRHQKTIEQGRSQGVAPGRGEIEPDLRISANPSFQPAEDARIVPPAAAAAFIAAVAVSSPPIVTSCETFRRSSEITVFSRC